MNLILSNKFKKSYYKFTKNNYKLKKNINNTLRLMSEDIYNSKLNTHKLSGKLSTFLSCSCGFDCRIIFKLVKNKSNNEEILLLDIGTHKEVY